MDDDDDFTFPTVAARGPTTTAPERQLGRDDQDTAPHLLHLPAAALPNLIAAGASTPLWPFAGSVPKTMATTTAPPVTADDDEQGQAPVHASGSGSARGLRSAVPEEEEEGQRAAADEDRMDLLWEAATTTATATARSITTAASAPPEPRSVAGAHAARPPAPPPPKQRADVDDDKQRAAALADAERMDKLWESFNEDLVLRHRHRDRARRTKSAAEHPAGGSSRVVPRAPAGGPDDDDDRWYLCNYDSPSSGAGAGSESDQETTSASSPAERRGYGCAPTMLRASSRAGGAGQFCGASATSPRTGRRRRGHRGAAAGWTLLLRLFRRLFAVDKTTAPSPSSRRSHSSLYVP